MNNQDTQHQILFEVLGIKQQKVQTPEAGGECASRREIGKGGPKAGWRETPGGLVGRGGEEDKVAPAASALIRPPQGMALRSS